MLSTIKTWLFGDAPSEASAPIYKPHIAVPPDAGAGSATDEQRPVIGISAGGADSKSLAAMVTQLRSAGAEPVVIVDHAQRIRRHGGVEAAVDRSLRGLDALVVLGNDRDMPAESYGETPHAKTKSLLLNDDGTPSVDGVARRTFEKLAMMRAFEAGMPLMGVCGGMQSFNVDGGGTLHQHVPDLVGDNHHMQLDNKTPLFVPVQFVKILEGTQMADIAGNTPGVYTPQHGDLPPGVFMENSAHHQAVKDVRPDFRISAVSEDGVIEGMESREGKPARFVQWHPEFGASELGAKLATLLTQEAQTYALAKSEASEANLTGQMATMILQRRQNMAMHLSI